MQKRGSTMNPTPPPATPPHVVRFSTDDLPERDRIAYTREVYGRSLCGLDIEPDAGVPLRITQAVTILPDLYLNTIDCSPHTARRTRSLLTDGNDSLFLLWNPDGPNISTNCGREANLASDNAGLFSAADVGVNYFGRTTCHTSLTLSRRLIRMAVPNIENFLVQPIASDTPALRLLKGYLNTWQNGELAATGREQQALSNHVYDLVALLFGAKGDAAHQAAQGGARAARLAQIHREIEHGVLDPDFSLPELALRVCDAALFL
jgi:hypothetical protein